MKIHKKKRKSSNGALTHLKVKRIDANDFIRPRQMKTAKKT
jgi:hypothetical protein